MCTAGRTQSKSEAIRGEDGMAESLLSFAKLREGARMISALEVGADVMTWWPRMPSLFLSDCDDFV